MINRIIISMCILKLQKIFSGHSKTMATTPQLWPMVNCNYTHTESLKYKYITNLEKPTTISFVYSESVGTMIFGSLFQSSLWLLWLKCSFSTKQWQQNLIYYFIQNQISFITTVQYLITENKIWETKYPNMQINNT